MFDFLNSIFLPSFSVFNPDRDFLREWNIPSHILRYLLLLSWDIYCFFPLFTLCSDFLAIRSQLCSSLLSKSFYFHMHIAVPWCSQSMSSSSRFSFGHCDLPSCPHTPTLGRCWQRHWWVVSSLASAFSSVSWLPVSNQIFPCSPLNSTHFPSITLVLLPWWSFCYLFLSCCWECTKSSLGQWMSSFFDTHPWPMGSEVSPVALWPDVLWNSATGNCRGVSISVRIWLLKAAVPLTCEQSVFFHPRVNIFTWCGTILSSFSPCL